MLYQQDKALIDMALLQPELHVLVFLCVHIIHTQTHTHTVNGPQQQKCGGHPIDALAISVTAETVRPAE